MHNIEDAKSKIDRVHRRTIESIGQKQKQFSEINTQPRQQSTNRGGQSLEAKNNPQSTQYIKSIIAMNKSLLTLKNSCHPDDRRDLYYIGKQDLSYRRDDKIYCILRLKIINMFSTCGLYTAMKSISLS